MNLNIAKALSAQTLKQKPLSHTFNMMPTLIRKRGKKARLTPPPRVGQSPKGFKGFPQATKLNVLIP